MYRKGSFYQTVVFMMKMLIHGMMAPVRWSAKMIWVSRFEIASSSVICTVSLIQ